MMGIEKGARMTLLSPCPVAIDINVGLDGGFTYYVPQWATLMFDRWEDDLAIALYQDPDGRYVDIEVPLSVGEFRLEE